jgi:transcriptional regulator with XRE-family HTH domain
MAVFASSGFWAFVQYLINRHDGTKTELQAISAQVAQLAEKVGKTVPYLSDIERGNRRGTYATLEMIARVLDLPVEEIWEVA